VPNQTVTGRSGQTGRQATTGPPLGATRKRSLVPRPPAKRPLTGLGEGPLVA